MTSERPTPKHSLRDKLKGFSKEAIESAERMGRLHEEIEKQIRDARPEAPDDTGERGIYNEKLSHFLGRPVYQTKNNIFFHFGDVTSVVPDRFIKKAREYYLETEKIDILYYIL